MMVDRIVSTLCRYVTDNVTDVLKMCMKKFDAEKIVSTNLWVFNLDIFRRLHLVNDG